MTRLLFLLLSMILAADGLMTFLIPVVVYAKTGQLAYSGLSYFLCWIPRLILVPMVGQFIDRLGVKPVSISSDLCKIVAGIIVVILTNYELPSILFVIVCGVLGGCVSIGNSQTLISYEKMIALVSKNIEHDINIITRLDQLAMIIGPLVGVIFFTSGFQLLIIIAILIYFANALFFLFYKQIPRNEPHVHVATNFKVAVNNILSNNIIIIMIFLAIGNNMFDGTIESSGVAIVDKYMHLPMQYFGLIDICAGCCGVLSTYLYGYLLKKMSSDKLFKFAWALSVISAVLIVLFLQNLIIFLTLYSVTIATRVFVGNHMRITRIRTIDKHSLASTSSIITLCNLSILPMVGISIYLFNHYGLSINYLVVISIFITFIFGLLVLRNQKL